MILSKHLKLIKRMSAIQVFGLLNVTFIWAITLR